MDQLKNEHSKVVSDHMNDNDDPDARNSKTLADYKEKALKGDTSIGYVLEVYRDGQSDKRALIFYGSIVDAVDGYNRYTDWGFAKDYITVNLHEPIPNRVTTKTIYRPRGGECTFVKQDYIDAEEIILKLKQMMSVEAYTLLVSEFARLFSRDNIRFDYERFFRRTECEIPENIEFIGINV